jgi:FkbM family methyltransferase
MRGCQNKLIGIDKLIKPIRRLVNRTGFDVVRVATFHKDIESHLAHIIVGKQIDGVIDVGANNGQYAAMLRRLGFAGHIYSFEPVASVFAELERAATNDPKWHCFKIALGDKPAKRTINVYNSKVFSSFLDANDYSKEIWAGLKETTPEEVTVARLDDLFDALPHRGECRHFMLKLDTQGFDLNAFHGASRIIGEVDVLQSEVALIAIYEGLPDPFKVLGEYRDQGFLISGMFPINRDVSLAVIEYDCVMVRKERVSGRQ